MADVVDNPDQERYEIRVDGALAGFAVYKRRPGLIAFIHTEVDPRFEGQGIGGQLARSVLDAARADGEQVLPFCPFIRGWIEQHPAYVDLVPSGQRVPFGLVPAGG